MRPKKHIWVFNGQYRGFPGGIFTTMEKAEEWIKTNKLSGTLTAYPVDQGCFDWAVENDVTNLKPEKLDTKKNDPEFIGSFSTASQEHYHYLNGEKD